MNARWNIVNLSSCFPCFFAQHVVNAKWRMKKSSALYLRPHQWNVIFHVKFILFFTKLPLPTSPCVVFGVSINFSFCLLMNFHYALERSNETFFFLPISSTNYKQLKSKLNFKWRKYRKILYRIFHFTPFHLWSFFLIY